jgi:hypothetical protein
VKIEIKPTILADIRSFEFRKKDREEAEKLGLNPRKALFWAYRHAILRRTAFIDGIASAMWGICGVPLGIIGQPYLVTGPLVEKISPIKFARIYKQEVEYMKQLFPRLENYVDFSYSEAVRMLKLANFSVDHPIRIGAKETLVAKYYWNETN